MSFPRYSEYKNDAPEWIESIPINWSISPLYAVVNECNQSNLGMIENNLLSLSYGQIVNKDITSNDGLLPESFETYQIVDRNDIVLRLTDLQNDKRSLRSAKVTERGIITSAYLAIRPKGIHPNYLSYLLRSYDLSKVFYSMGGGLRQSMKFIDLKRLPILIPSPTEQKLITHFLDQEISKIDALIEEQEKLIELLKEKRQAVISHAVTKGIDPNVKMKDSGVAWLGLIPKHWELIRLRRIVKLNPSKSEINHLKRTLEVSFLPMESIGDNGQLNLDKVKSIAEVEFGYTYFANNDITIAKITPCFENGKGAIMRNLINGIGFGTTELIVVRPNASRVDTEFLYWFFLSTYFRKSAEGSMYGAGGQKRLSDDFVREFMATLPLIKEQKEIVQFINSQTKLFDTLETESRNTKNFLSERRSALISAAVTGQIDVRNVAITKEAA